MKISSRRSIIAAAVIAVGAMLVAIALFPPIAARDETAIRELVAKQFPDIRIESLSKSPIPGLYELYYGGRIVYVDDKVNYVLQGPLLDAKGRWNLTAESLGKFAAIPFDELPFDSAFKIVKGTGQRKLALFGDPASPAVRHIEQELTQVDHMTLYVFLLPFEHRNPGATDKAHGIWCATDRAGAWHEAVANGRTPPTPATCSAPIDDTLKLASKHHINILPTLVFANGLRMTGALSASHIERLLAAAAAPSAR
ncbi:DsbC family protein [Variovorax paradoxus]|nr:DsbC family protein [Variovorax paradoxus]MBT2303258.1 DsbC family protein [Variovorax paradoxus]